MSRLSYLCEVRNLKVLAAIILMVFTIAVFPSITEAGTSSPVDADPQVWRVKRDAVENIAKRTRNSKTFDNLDGSYTVVIGRNYHYESAKGQWEDIDTKLENGLAKNINGQAYDLYITKAPFHAYFGKNSNAPQLFEVPEKGQILIEPIGPNSSVGKVEGSKVTYFTAWDDVDWVRTILPDGVKSDIILHSAAAQNEFRFKVQAPNLDYEQQSNGAVLWKQGEEVVAMFQPATVVDAAGKEGVAYQRIEATADGLELIMGADPNWLAASDREWPITIDPTITIQPIADGIDTYVSIYNLRRFWKSTEVVLL